MVFIVAEETGLDWCAAGGTTCKRQDIAKGFEPDSSFYFRHATVMRDKDELELPNDPPPELTIEVDITRSSLDRFRIFAGIGVEEVWSYDGDQVRFHRLVGDSYTEVEVSVVLPPITATQATIFLKQYRREKSSIAWIRSVREWVRAQL